MQCRNQEGSRTGPPSKIHVQERPLSVDLNRPPELSGSWLLLLWVAPQMANHLQRTLSCIVGAIGSQ